MQKPTRFWAALLAIGALGLSSCAAEEEIPEATAPPAESTTDLDVFYDQTIAWESCAGHDDFECATVDVPMDYNDPHERTIQIHLTRAEEQAHLQPMLFNPGGPGSSGVDFVQNLVSGMLSEQLKNNISAIGFDPRGVGASEPVECLTDEEFDESRQEDYDASTPEGWRESIERTRQLGEKCLERSGEIVKHVDTISAAKDMDIIRAALEAPKLDYFGISYGTKLGATYAELFPDQVGKFVLDSVLTPSAETFEVTKAQSVGFEQSLNAWFQWCAQDPDCGLGEPGDADSVEAEVVEFIAGVQEEPLIYPDGRTQPASDLFFGMIMPLYSQDSWDLLWLAIEQARDGNYANSDHLPLFQYFADAYHGRDLNGEYDNTTEAFTAINCLDYAGGDKTLEQAKTEAQELAEDAPIFGPAMSYASGCNGWPVAPVEPLGPTVAQGSEPIIVTSLTSDPATPIHFSHELAEQLDNSVHITVEGDGHGAYSPTNECITSAIDGYIMDDQLPEDGLVCE